MSDLMAADAAASDDDSNHSTVSIEIIGTLTKDGAVVSWVSSDLNRPKTNNNILYVWQTTESHVPWTGQPPVGTAAVTSDKPVSQQMIDFAFDLDSSYIVGYAVGADVKDTCATVTVPNPMDEGTYDQANTTITKVLLRSAIAQVSYAGLAGYDRSSNWIGIWNSANVPYHGTAPLGSVNLSGTDQTGTATIDGLSLTIGTTYSIGYFMAAAPAGKATLAAQWVVNT